MIILINPEGEDPFIVKTQIEKTMQFSWTEDGVDYYWKHIDTSEIGSMIAIEFRRYKV